ncbi:MAG: hypothetical protein AB7E31_00595 [Desulfitobacterium sp.]
MRKAIRGIGLETGRFQPPIEQERFGRGPDGADGLSISFVRAAY